MACLVWGATALADETSDFEKARIAYLKKDYTEASARFDAMLDPTKGTLTTKALINEAEFCYGAVKFAQGRKDEAHKLWEKVILDTNAQYEPDPLTYPSDVLQDFITQKTNMNAAVQHQQQAQQAADAARREKEAAERRALEARVKQLEGIASVETVVVQNSRETALLPFGIGQFQNHQDALGWFFLVTEGLAVVTTCVLFFPYRYNIDQYNATLQGAGSLSYRTQLADEYAAVAQDIRTADFIVLGALGALAITGIIQAEVAFKPILTYTRKRKVSAVWPSFAPLPSGAALGLQGRF
jgi:TolA-binding protein